MIITSEDVTEAPLDPMQIFGHQLLSWGMLTHILIKEHMKGISITIIIINPTKGSHIPTTMITM
jgi:hypothetical protein